MVPNCGPEANPPLKCVDWIMFSAIDFFINFFSSPVIWFNLGSAVIPESLGVNIDNLQQHLRVKHLQQIKSFLTKVILRHSLRSNSSKKGQTSLSRSFTTAWWTCRVCFESEKLFRVGITIENMYVHDYYNLDGCNFRWVNFYINTSRCKQFACLWQSLVSVIGK